VGVNATGLRGGHASSITARTEGRSAGSTFLPATLSTYAALRPPRQFSDFD
jgi:hypothetical protein